MGFGGSCWAAGSSTACPALAFLGFSFFGGFGSLVRTKLLEQDPAEGRGDM
jgi:hypothetical protein